MSLKDSFNPPLREDKEREPDNPDEQRRWFWNRFIADLHHEPGTIRARERSGVLPD